MTTSAKKKTVGMVSIGAIKHLSLEIPEDGGIVVLQGRNGRGKSTAIKAIQSALTGSGSLEANDKALSGSVEAFGVTITVGKSTRRKGKLEVESLEGKLSLGDLIDPMLKTPEAADAKRIKALVTLSGAEASPAMFESLLGPNELSTLCRSDTLKQTDLVAMAEAIKRDLDGEARREEDAAQKAEGVALGATNAIGDIDITQESNAETLQADLEAKLSAEMNLAARVKANQDAVAAAAAAQQEIQNQEDSYGGPSLEECTSEVAKAKEHCQITQNAVAEAERVLAQARNDFESARHTLSLAISQQKDAERHEKTIAAAKAALQATIPEAPCAEELEAAKAATQAARDALERGTLIRQALQHITARDEATSKAKAHAKKAAMLREAGKGTDDVLSGVVQKLGTSLRVVSGRLVLDTHRGETYYHDLSDGERAKIAIEIAISVVGEGGIITLDQRIYEGIDPVNRKELSTLLKSRKATMLTAEVSADDEIKAGVL